jgi:hypothetical protein
VALPAGTANAIVARKARVEFATRLDEHRKLRGVVAEEYQRAALELGIALDQTTLAWIESLPRIKGDRGRS